MVCLKPFHQVLGYLALLGVTNAYVPLINADCIVQAWVRAPDLAPNTIVQGDTRFKISAGCPAVETVSLGLRLKERSFVKVLRSREDKDRLRSAQSLSRKIQEVASPWAFPLLRHPADGSEGAAFSNKDLWIVREEEQVVFETIQAMQMNENASGNHDVVQDFAILVPSTNLPPALDYLRHGIMITDSNTEMVRVESIYEYFVRVPFVNGTTRDISAGLTSFQPLYDPTETVLRPSSETVGLKRRHCGLSGKDSSTTNYTAQIDSVSGLVLTEGPNNQVTVVITRTGPARTFNAPLKVRACAEPKISLRWADDHNVTTFGASPQFVLRSTSEDIEEKNRRTWQYWCSDQLGPGAEASVITMPNSTSDEIQSRAIATTTSMPVTIPIHVNRRHITNFETYYQTLANSLLLTLEIPPTTKNELLEDESCHCGPNVSPQFEDDEAAWVPWEKQSTFKWCSHLGRVPAVVRPMNEVTALQGCLYGGTDASVSAQVVLSDGQDCGRPSPIHYLKQGARGPVFVDPASVQKLLAEDPAEREHRAPILQPVVSSPLAGEELISRYYGPPHSLREVIYVGETWGKKVVKKGQHHHERNM